MEKDVTDKLCSTHGMDGKVIHIFDLIIGNKEPNWKNQVWV